MKKHIIIFSGVFMAALLCLFSCTPTDRFEAGRPITREELAEMSASISDADTEAETAADTNADTTKTAESVPDDGTVYWTESGSVYHTHADCGHLRNSVAVQSGTVAESGKAKLCSTCAKKQAS